MRQSARKEYRDKVLKLLDEYELSVRKHLYATIALANTYHTSNPQYAKTTAERTEAERIALKNALIDLILN